MADTKGEAQEKPSLSGRLLQVLGTTVRVAGAVGTLGLSEAGIAIKRRFTRKKSDGSEEEVEENEQENAVADPIPAPLPVPLPVVAVTAPTPVAVTVTPPAPVAPPVDIAVAVNEYNSALNESQAAESEAANEALAAPTLETELAKLKADAQKKADDLKRQAEAFRAATANKRVATKPIKDANEAKRAEIARLKSFLGQ